MTSKLDKNGNVPAGKECPYKEKCLFSMKCAIFFQNSTETAFSCAFARAFDMFEKEDMFEE